MESKLLMSRKFMPPDAVRGFRLFQDSTLIFDTRTRS